MEIIKKIKSSINCMLKTILAGIISLFILSAFVLIYNYSGIHISNNSGATDYKWESNQLKTNMVEGFSFVRMDSNGFNNVENQENVDILIMGSSHMEAINVSQKDSTSYLLKNKLQTYSVYNIGMSGHDIYYCAKNMKSAVDLYNPNKYVIVETNDIHMDNIKMEKVLNNKLETIPSYENGLIYYIQKYCPAFKMIYKNIDDWKNENASAAIDCNNVMYDEKTLDEFLSYIRNNCGDNRKLVIIYHPSSLIDSKGEIIKENGYDLNEFKLLCDKNDIIFIDMTHSFEEFYKKKHILAHGFINTAVGRGHLNKYGHKMIAEKLCEAILEDQ